MFRTAIWFTYMGASLLGSRSKMKMAERLEKDGDIQARDKIVDSVVGPWARKLVKLSGTTVTVQGMEHIKQDKPLLIVANHQSNFDIPILLGYVDMPKGFIAKVELETFPVVNRWMRLMQCVFMDRNDMRQSAKSIMQGIKNLKKGYTMVVFPEGTRSEDGSLLEFKPGALKLATKSGVNVLPITISGSKDIMTKGSKRIKPAQVTLTISEPIEITDALKQDTFALTEKIKGVIESNL